MPKDARDEFSLINSNFFFFEVSFGNNYVLFQSCKNTTTWLWDFSKGQADKN